jgi:site-specific DNA recombinase
MTDPVRAAIYCRMSLARFGDSTKVEDQERICREMTTRLGWEVAEVYSDNNRSAWQKRRNRPGWNAMLAAVDAGKVNAIVTYHGDRLVRQPGDLETLIDLADGRGIRLASPTGERNLDHSEDRIMLRVLTAFSVAESDATSRRKKGQHERWRREGKVRAGGRGGRAFGFATDGITHIPAETQLAREAASRILGGEPTGAVARDLSARGVRTTSGNLITHATLRKMLARPRYAGLMPDGQSPAAWEPVLDRETWEATVAALNAKAGGYGYATNARKYLLSGIAVCGVCGAALQARSEGRKRRHLAGYGCVQPGCRKVQRSVRLLDEYVITRVLSLLAHPLNPAGQIPASPGLAAQFAALTAARAEIMVAVADPGQGPLAQLLARLTAVDERLAQLRDLAAGDARGRLLAAHTGISRDCWDGLPLPVRRTLVAACYRVRVLPASHRGPGFDPRDVILTPAGLPTRAEAP